MTTNRNDVESLALALFGATQCKKALDLIDEYGKQSHEHEVDRVKLAILQVSDGKLSRLPYFVNCAKIDYRDVLTGQRLGPMSEEDEAKWQTAADRMLAIWNAK
jgi:hypothetical protein